MKITTKKIIRELEKKGYSYVYLHEEIIKATRNVIDEILKEQKGITIKK
jgi:vacuolar-type H+-ATPase subunit F/Vma7